MTSRGVVDVVLVADADPAVGALFRRAAEGLPLQIIQASNAHEAWRRVLTERPVAVFSDYRLLGCDGVSLLERVRLLLPSSQRVLHTSDRVTRPLNGVDLPILAKPCDPEALRALLWSIAGEAPRAVAS